MLTFVLKGSAEQCKAQNIMTTDNAFNMNC